MTYEQYEGYLAGAIFGNLTSLHDGEQLFAYYVNPNETDPLAYDMENEPINGCTWCILDAAPASLGDTSKVAAMSELEIEALSTKLAEQLAPRGYDSMLAYKFARI